MEGTYSGKRKRKSTNVFLSESYEEWARQKENYEGNRGQFRAREGFSTRDFPVCITHGDFAKHLLDIHSRFCEFCRVQSSECQTRVSKYPVASSQEEDCMQNEVSELQYGLLPGQTCFEQSAPHGVSRIDMVQPQKSDDNLPVHQSTPVLPCAVPSASKSGSLQLNLAEQFCLQSVTPIPESTSGSMTFVESDKDSNESCDDSSDEDMGGINILNDSMAQSGNQMCNETVESEVFPPEQTNFQEMEDDESIDDGYDDSMASIDDAKCIISLRKILDLLKCLHGEMCTFRNCKLPLNYEWNAIGTAIIFSWGCNSGHNCGKWYSQDRYCKMFAGNIQYSSAVTISGNNFSKISLYFKVCKIFFVSQTTFLRVQRLYIHPAVKAFWHNVQENELCKLKSKSLCVAGDGRTDSPGHCAQYCTYTFMDESTSKVLHLEVVDVSEVGGKSTNMEKLAFERGLDFLVKEATVSQVVTDGHIQIKALLKNCTKYEDVSHQIDIWHGAKNVVKKVAGVANAKENNDLWLWIPAIRNHFWYSARVCGGDALKLKSVWLSLLHHIVNEHDWFLSIDGSAGKCNHEDISHQLEGHDKPWLKKGSSAHNALRAIMLKKQFLNTLPYYKDFKHTGSLESFHNHMLMYASKRNSYSYHGYQTRMYLAAIDHNYHSERAYDYTADGKLVQRAKFNKRSKQWVPQRVKVQKDFGYIPDIMRKVFAARQENQGHLSQRVELSEDDPKNIRSNIANVPRPSTDVLFHEHKSRFKSV